MSAVIEVQNLSKRYPGASEDSLKGISFDVLEGEKLGVFGPNGAGKTTLMSLMCGILSPNTGEVRFRQNGQPVSLKSMRFRMGYVPQDFAFYPELTPMQNLMYFGALYGIDTQELKRKSEELLHILGLSHVARKRVSTFSGGMKRRVNLAIGIVNNPSILFLDEPTVGVDVQSKHAIMSYLDTLNAAGTTIIYTSHHMNEGQEFCDRIVLLDHGTLIVQDDLDQLLTTHGEQSLEGLFLKLTGTAYRD